MNRASFVILRGAGTDGLLWELKTLLARVERRKVIITLPADTYQFEIFKKVLEKELGQTIQAPPLSIFSSSTIRGVVYFDLHQNMKIFFPSIDIVTSKHPNARLLQEVLNELLTKRSIEEQRRIKKPINVLKNIAAGAFLLLLIAFGIKYETFRSKNDSETLKEYNRILVLGDDQCRGKDFISAMASYTEAWKLYNQRSNEDDNKIEKLSEIEKRLNSIKTKYKKMADTCLFEIKYNFFYPYNYTKIPTSSMPASVLYSLIRRDITTMQLNLAQDIRFNMQLDSLGYLKEVFTETDKYEYCYFEKDRIPICPDHSEQEKKTNTRV